MLDPQTTAVLILGVSECPKAPAFQPLPQSANSAAAFQRYLTERLNLPGSQILNLFGSTKHASEQLEQINDWLERIVAKGKATDFFLYYTGHGGFSRSDQSYFLAVQQTSQWNEGATSIRYADLAHCLKQHATRARRYVILDCCYAAAAVPKHQSDLNQMVIRKVADEMPSSGTALLCSSSSKLVSIAPEGKEFTMFSGALLKALNDGIPRGPRSLSLVNIAEQAQNIILEEFDADVVRPELHIPDQQKGNPAAIPLFPNAQGMDDPFVSNAQTFSDLSTLSQPKIRESSIWIWSAGIASGLVATVFGSLVRYPMGLSTAPGDFGSYPPVIPAVCLLFALITTTIPTPKSKQILAIALSVFVCWALAWNYVLHLGGYVVPIGGDPGLVVNVTIASFIGAASLLVALDAIAGRFHFDSFAVRRVILKSALFSVLTCTTMLGALIGHEPLFSACFSLALFVPWHLMMLDVSQRPSGARSKRLPFGRHFGLIFLSLLVFSFVLTKFGAYFTIYAKKWFSDQPIALQVLDASSSPGSGGNKIVAVKYRTVKVISDTLNCSMQLQDQSNERQFVERTGRDTSISMMVSDDMTAQFEIPENAEGPFSVRQSCTGNRIEYYGPWLIISF